MTCTYVVVVNFSLFCSNQINLFKANTNAVFFLEKCSLLVCPASLFGTLFYPVKSTQIFFRVLTWFFFRVISMTPNFFQAATLKKIWVEATYPKKISGVTL